MYLQFKGDWAEGWGGMGVGAGGIMYQTDPK